MNGALYVAGSAYENAGPGSILPRAFVARYDIATGSRAWEILYGSIEGSSGAYGCRSIRPAPEGDLYVGCERPYGSIAVLRVTAGGSVAWVRLRATDGGLPAFRALEVDAFGDVYLGGDGPGGIGSIGRYAPNGDLLEEWSFQGPEVGAALAAMTVDNDRNLYLAGSTQVSGLGAEAIVAKYDATGGELWTRTYGGEGPFANDGFMTIGLVGETVVAGGSITSTTLTNRDAFAVGQSLGGVERFAETYAGAFGGDDAYLDLEPDGEGGLYAVGLEAMAANDTDALIVRFDALGARLWERRVSGVSEFAFDVARVARRSPDGGVAIVGDEGVGDFTYQILYARLGAAGELLDRAAYPEPMAGSRGRGLALDTAGNAYVTGGDFGETSGEDVVTMRFAGPAPLFADGFESGDLASWDPPPVP